jgi:opacity protein-like surface antigen
MTRQPFCAFRQAAVAAVILTALALATPASADSGLYIGGHYGTTDYRQTGDLQRFCDRNDLACQIDGSDNGWKIFLGAQMTSFFAIEGGAINLGTATVSTAVGGQEVRGRVELDGFFIAVLPQIPVTPLATLYGRFGLHALDGTARVEAPGTGLSVRDSERGAGWSAGVGVGLNLTPQLTLRAEFERITFDEKLNVDNEDSGRRPKVDLKTIGLVLRF